MKRADGPPPFLALDTSTPVGSVAVGRGERLLAEVVMGAASRHAEALMPAVDFALARAGIAPAALCGIVVAGGPGSFTGVRIAGAAAKGLARALGLPLYAYSGLLALAAGAAGCERSVCALFDARREEVYAACYRFAASGVHAASGGTDAGVSTLLAPAPRALADVLADHAVAGALFVGDGALRHRARIEAAGGRVAPVHLAWPRASALLWLVEVQPSGRVDDVAAWEPAYLRPSGAERAACD